MPAAAMKTLPFVSLLLFCSLESATAAEYMVKIDTFGAYNKEDLKTAVRYSAEHDTDAVVQLMYEGKLVPVDEGMKLFSTNYNLFEPRYIQVREKGSTKPFWVLLEQVQQIEQKETPEPSPSAAPASAAPANTKSPKQAGIEWGKAAAGNSCLIIVVLSANAIVGNIFFIWCSKSRTQEPSLVACGARPHRRVRAPVPDKAAICLVFGRWARSDPFLGVDFVDSSWVFLLVLF